MMMNGLWRNQKETTNALFFGFSAEETQENTLTRLVNAKRSGFSQIVASYKTKGMQQARFDKTYFAALDQLTALCREAGILFWLEDYAPFPTGSANGAYQEKEHEKENKLFIDERHVDVVGPAPDTVFRTEQLLRSVFGKSMHRFQKVSPPTRKKLAIVACPLRETDCAAAPALELGSAVRLDGLEKDGFLKWDVPEGRWRLFVLFETPESAGRAYFMNLLSRASVQLEIQRVHQLLYDHLQNELGKTWLGFFYDEPEIGNNGGDQVFDFFMLPGKRSHDFMDIDTLPWCDEMPFEMAKRDPDWLLHLPGLWYEADDMARNIRYAYMDAVSALVRENYSGQVYRFCRERGVRYIGHVLEDEGCHDKLGCGPSHYFRQQFHQDEAGIDVIAGQILPGKDQSAVWYGAPNADGEFYHYGLAKLASSEAHINPNKQNRAFAEVFAMYGQQGMAERKFLIDHLLVNGVNRMLFMSEFAATSRAGYAEMLLDYSDRMCALSRNCEWLPDVAILYHAEMEWREGNNAGRFQRIGAALARCQIGYDVLPSDVFAFPDWYCADFSRGLSVNGHVYQALIIPACGRLPTPVLSFVHKAKQGDFPIVFVERAPDGMRENAIPLSGLTNHLKTRIKPAIEATSSGRVWLRTSHLRDGENDLYFMHNEAPRGSMDCKVRLNAKTNIYQIDPVTCETFVPHQVVLENGYREIELHLGQYEMTLLFASNAPDALIPGKQTPVEASGCLVFPDGSEERFLLPRLPRPENHTGFGFAGLMTYCFHVNLQEAPSWIELGEVSDCCEIFFNGKSAGKRMAAPYRFRVNGLLHPGENEVKALVYASAGNETSPATIFGVPADALTALPYSTVLPMGIQGPVQWLFDESRAGKCP